MYLSFYNLKRKPFQISTDPKFLWMGEKHKEALATLKYGIMDNKGFLLLTGDVGTGKTTLINALLKDLDKNTLVATIRDPALDPIDFYNYTAYIFGMQDTFASKAPFLIQFERFLLETYKSGKKVLLIIDEAQRISQELLEEVRLLSNIEREDTKLLNIFFIGQNEFNDTLLRPENRAIRQRITINYHILPLSIQETRLYIRHRLEVAGAGEEIFSLENLERDSKNEFVKHSLMPPEEEGCIFSDEAVKEVYTYSKGYPRLINIICDRSLLTGFVEEATTITGKHVRECAKELAIPHLKRNRNIPKREPERHEDQAARKAINQEPEITCEEIPVRKKNSFSKSFIYTATTVFLLSLLVYGFLMYDRFPDDRAHALVEYIHGLFSATAYDSTIRRKSDTIPGEKYSLPSNRSNESGTEVGRSAKKGERVDSPPVEESKSSSTKSAPEKIGTEIPTLIKSTAARPAPVRTYEEETETNSSASRIVEKSNVSTETTIFEPRTGGDTAADSSAVQDRSGTGLRKEIDVKSLVTYEKLVIPFPSNSNLPPADSLNKLDHLVNSLLNQPHYNIIVTGFTDSQGNDSFNEKLSEFRANTIKSYLVGRGLKESGILTRGKGSLLPIASNDTPAGRMANRRVEIEIER